MTPKVHRLIKANGEVMQLLIGNAKAALGSSSILAVADRLNWVEINKHMQAEFSRETQRKGGRVPFDFRSMFRALLLSRWFGLSYPKLERALSVRLDFLLFCEFDIGGKLPDSCTLNRFNSRLNESGVSSVLFAEVNSQLSKAGILIFPSEGALVDPKIRISP